MKKSLIAVLAIAGVVACNKTEVVEVAQPGAIQFENAFVDNATRAEDPSTTTESLQEFAVYGYMDQPSGMIFNAEKVSKNEAGAWTYTNIQYWAPSHKYFFAAVSPVDTQVDTRDANQYGIGWVSFVQPTDNPGSVDLLYSAVAVETPATIAAQPEAVKFTFNHLLSKVKFTFKNAFPNDNATLLVENITMTSPERGSIKLAEDNWWGKDDAWLNNGNMIPLAFGNTAEIASGASNDSAQERLTIPANSDMVYTVTFDVTLKYGNVVAYKAEKLTSEITGVEFEIGKAYNLVAVLDAKNIVPGDSQLYPIEFEVVKVKDWDYVDDITVIETPVETPEVTPAE